jgi:hypothetical protein
MARTIRSLTVGAVALTTAVALAGPAQAHGSGHHGRHHTSGLSLTRSAAAVLDANDIDVRIARSAHRSGHHGHGLIRIRGAVVFDGPDNTTWSRVRINERTNRVTAIVNGGDRRAVLRFRGTCSGGDDDRSFRSGHHGHGDRGSLLRLTGAGAASLDAAANRDIFDAGDAFAHAKG